MTADPTLLRHSYGCCNQRVYAPGSCPCGTETALDFWGDHIMEANGD